MSSQETIKPIECPVCLGTKIENTLHKGSMLCYRCYGTGNIGHSKPVENIKAILSKPKKDKK